MVPSRSTGSLANTHCCFKGRSLYNKVSKMKFPIFFITLFLLTSALVLAPSYNPQMNSLICTSLFECFSSTNLFQVHVLLSFLVSRILTSNFFSKVTLLQLLLKLLLTSCLTFFWPPVYNTCDSHQYVRRKTFSSPLNSFGLIFFHPIKFRRRIFTCRVFQHFVWLF